MANGVLRLNDRGDYPQAEAVKGLAAERYAYARKVDHRRR